MGATKSPIAFDKADAFFQLCVPTHLDSLFTVSWNCAASLVDPEVKYTSSYPGVGAVNFFLA